MDEKKISVIIPTFNGGKYIKAALESIFIQSRRVDEILIYDDASTDDTVEIIERLNRENIRLFRQSHTGDPAFGRNKGIATAHGDYIAFLDQDDLWPKNKIKIQLAHLEKNSKALVDVGLTKVMVDQKPGKKTTYANRVTETGSYFLLSSGLFRRQVFDRVGIFDETLKYLGSDFDWILRAAEKEVLFFTHREITLIYRIHENNYSNNLQKLKGGLAEVFARSLIRRKKEGGGGFTAFPKLKTITENEIKQ